MPISVSPIHGNYTIDSINYHLSQDDFFPVYPPLNLYKIQAFAAPKTTTKEFQQGEKSRRSRDSRLET
jgi:hypothetical protein